MATPLRILNINPVPKSRLRPQLTSPLRYRPKPVLQLPRGASSMTLHGVPSFGRRNPRTRSKKSKLQKTKAGIYPGRATIPPTRAPAHHKRLENPSRSSGCRPTDFPSTGPEGCAILGTRTERSRSPETGPRLNQVLAVDWSACSTVHNYRRRTPMLLANNSNSNNSKCLNPKEEYPTPT